jgi:hypothetical protein
MRAPASGRSASKARSILDEPQSRGLLGRQYRRRAVCGICGIFQTGGPPRHVVQRDLLDARTDEGRVVDEPIEPVRHVLSQIAATDVVVATRFTTSSWLWCSASRRSGISFHYKCDALMNQMRLSEYRHDLSLDTYDRPG